VAENTMTERVSPTVETAKTEMSSVTDHAAQQARVVTREAGEQARSAIDRVQDDLRTRADEEVGKLARTLHETSDQLRAMSGVGGNESSMPATLAQEGAQAAERLASRLEEGADTVLADVRSWARRNPGGFLLGAAVGGFVIGRVVRNLPSSNDGRRSATPGNGSTREQKLSSGVPARPIDGA
jgi:predicted phage gp36 major capsid-like protein